MSGKRCQSVTYAAMPEASHIQAASQEQKVNICGRNPGDLGSDVHQLIGLAAVIACVAIMVALLATWIPARRAAALDPLLALRVE